MRQFFNSFLECACHFRRRQGVVGRAIEPNLRLALRTPRSSWTLPFLALVYRQEKLDLSVQQENLLKSDLIPLVGDERRFRLLPRDLAELKERR